MPMTRSSRRLPVGERRFLLTRDVGLLKRREVEAGYCVRSDQPHEQLREVSSRFALHPQFTPFRRCMDCNGHLCCVSKEEVIDLLPPHTRETKTEFSRCQECGKVFWRGSHHARMVGWIEELIAALDEKRGSDFRLSLFSSELFCLIPMMVGGCTGDGSGDPTNDCPDDSSLTVASRGSDQCARGHTASDDRGGPAIVTSVIVAVVVDRSRIDWRGLVNGCCLVAITIAPSIDATIIITTIIVSVIVVAPLVVARVAVSAIPPFTVTAVVGRLMLHSSTVVIVVAVLSRHRWNAGPNKRRHDVDRGELLNASHNCLRL